MSGRDSIPSFQLRPHQGRIKDLTNRRFSHWRVLECEGLNKHRTSVWRCRCDCGRTSKVTRPDLLTGHSRSCGCIQRTKLGRMSTTHGMSGTRVFRIWTEMHRRCYDPRRVAYQNYGGRGIIVCKRWHEFKNFFADMGYPSTPQHSIDRINNGGNYEPSNCRWATCIEQQRNRRNSHNLTVNGQTRTMSEWSEITGVSQSQMLRRIKRGWPIDEAVGVKEHISKQGQRPARTGFKTDYKAKAS